MALYSGVVVRVALALLFVATAGCDGWLRVAPVRTAERKPNNAWVFFEVREGDNAVKGVTANDISILDEGAPVPAADSRQVLQPTDSVAAFSTLLLVDASPGGPPADAMASIAMSFAARLVKTQHVAVFAFDGSKTIVPILAWGQAPTPSAFDALRTFKPRDSSSNLHGAVTLAVDEVKRSLDADTRPLKFGNLVVVVGGPDRGGRVDKSQMAAVLDDDRFADWDAYAVGVGAAASEAPLGVIGKTGVFSLDTPTLLASTLDGVAAKIEDRHDRFYLLSYCTPARGAQHSVRLEVRTGGDKPQTGSLQYTLNADGLGPPPACDSQAPAVFSQSVATTLLVPAKVDKSKATAKPPDGQKVLDWKPDP